VISTYFKNPLTVFIIKIVGLYLLWELLYAFFIHPIGKIDLFIVSASIKISGFILDGLGFRTFVGAQRLFGIDNTSGLWVGDPCNGLVLMAIFSAFIVSFPGKLISKFIFIPVGLIIIFFINVLRITFLAIIQYYFSRSAVEFHHSYTFTFLVYGVIVGMWLWWVNRFAYIKK
jgi:exosortase/archaeosortase family protein